MAGILNKKTRFIDLVITQEGKRQISSGELKAEYASVTDMHAFYKKHQTAEDVRNRIYFEVAERPENAIVLEKNDKGKIVQQDIIEGLILKDDNIVQYLATDSGTSELTDDKKLTLQSATGSQFSSLSKSVTSLSINHLDKNYLISTNRLRNNSENFTTNKENIVFTISNSIPFSLGPEREIVNVNNTDSFIQDKKLASLDNFAFLPPINEDGTSYGNYIDVRDTSETSFEEIINRLGLDAFSNIDQEESEAYNVKKNTSGDYKVYNREDEEAFENFLKKEHEVIKFTETSVENNLMIQIFELNESNIITENSNKVIKLDIIDAGFHLISNDVNNRNQKQVYYAGKIYYDTDNIPKFVNLFTIIFD
jgi:hypothetical protein